MKLENASVSITSSGGIMTALVSGEIDHHSAKDIREAIDASLLHSEPDRLEMDFHGVTFMDSSGLGLLLGRYTKATEAGIDFAVVRTTPNVQRMFDMAGLRRIVTFEDGCEGEKTKGDK